MKPLKIANVQLYWRRYCNGPAILLIYAQYNRLAAIETVIEWHWLGKHSSACGCVFQLRLFFKVKLWWMSEVNSKHFRKVITLSPKRSHTFCAEQYRRHLSESIENRWRRQWIWMVAELESFRNGSYCEGGTRMGELVIRIVESASAAFRV